MGSLNKSGKKVSQQVMREGVRLKFDSDPDLKKYLLDTNNKQLIEANPKDKYWGIGCSMHSYKAKDQKNWGKNFLGKILMAIRDEFAKQAKT